MGQGLGRGRIGFSIAAVAAVALVAGLPVARASEENPSSPWSGSASMIGGTAQVDRGEWIYQDFVYDDYGARAGRATTQTVALAPTTGSFRYPAGERYAGNAADIVEVRARPEGDDLLLRVTLGTLLDPSVPVIGVAIDTGAGSVEPWPHGAGVRSSWDRFATIAEGRMTLVDPTGTSHEAPAVVDLEANTIQVTVPGVGDGDQLQLTVGAGLWDADSGEWMAGSPAGVLPGTFDSGGVSLSRVFDLAFNDHDLEPRSGRWLEDAQADALLLGDVSDFSQDIDLDALRDETTQLYELQPGRFYNALFRSRQDLGEGMASSFPQYLSAIQPYGLWVPRDYDQSEATPLLVVLHSLSSHHNQYQGGATAPSYRTFYEQLADELGALAVTPLGRGPDGWYRNEALVDSLEVLADVDQRFSIDDDRTWLTGYSMGGYGTYRLGTLLPDRFAAAISWAGVPTDGDRLDNMRWVPTQIVHGTADELVPVTGVRTQAARFADLGHEYRYFEHPAEDHLSFVFKDHWTRDLDWLEDRVRTVNPPSVSLAVQPAMWTTSAGDARRAAILGHLEALDADFTSAYWVHDVGLRGSETARVEATSHAVAEREPVVEAYSGVSPALEPSPYLIQGQWRSMGARDIANRLELGLREVGTVTIDLGAASLDTTKALGVLGETDGPAELRLDGGYGAAGVTDHTGAPVPFTLHDGVVTVHLDAGSFHLTVAAADGTKAHPGKGAKPTAPPGRPQRP